MFACVARGLSLGGGDVSVALYRHLFTDSLTVGPRGQGVEEVPGWVRLVEQADKWLPVSGHGHVYLHEQK